MRAALFYAGSGLGLNAAQIIMSAPNGASRTLGDKSLDELSVLSQMTDAMRADTRLANPAMDHTAIFTAFIAYLAANKRTGLIPNGNYNISSTLNILSGASLFFHPNAKINYTGAAGPVFNVKIGSFTDGNNALVNITNPAWDDAAFLLSGSEQFGEASPTQIIGFRVVGIDITKGVGLQFKAQNAREWITFVKARNFSFNNLKTGFDVNCNGGGTADPLTWHWINSNICENFTFFYTKFGMVVNGTTSTPGQISGNQFLNFHFQPGTTAPLGAPVHITGASQNTFTGYIWDWDSGANGSPIILDGGAAWNSITSNIQASIITGSAGNKCYDLTGGETGQRIYNDVVSYNNKTYYGTIGRTGQYACLYAPDTSGGGLYWSKNDGTTYSFGTGGDPYAGTTIYGIAASTMTVGASSANASISKFRVNGDASKSVAAFRIGTDGFAGNLFENSAGTQVGFITINTTGVVYSTTSDYRLKGDVKPLMNSGEFVDSLNPVEWKWKVNGESGSGFIAHELQEVSPSSVVGVKDDVNKEGEAKYQAVDYSSSELIANIVAELQATRKRLYILENK